MSARRLLIGLAFVGVAASTPLSAHDLLLSTIDLVDRASGTEIVVTLPLSELARMEHAPAGAMTALDAEVAIRRRVLAGAALNVGASTVSIDAVADVVRWRATVPRPADAIVLRDRLLPDVARSYTRVRRISFAGAVNESWLGAASPAARTIGAASRAGALETAWNFVAMGFGHVVDGPDHIAFIVGLVLLGGTLRSLLMTVTAFTLAHSLTLALAATGAFSPPARVIEPLIALSIVAVALENLVRRGSLSRRPYYAFAFGLVHGFGLAGPLRAMGPAGGWLGLSLLPFNLGVELAQAAVVAALWPALAWLAGWRPAAARRLAAAGACTIGIAGAVWFVDRAGSGGGAGTVFAQLRPSSDDAAARVEASFKPFAPLVETRHDGQYFYVESNGMPDHRMMVGITAWQQQVPLPQPYTGANAWRFPLFAKPAGAPLSAKDHFFRGAIAIAANGVPIFNPIKNDGRTDTFLAGELDEFGGHGGRADDYHYHLPPLHLQRVLGNALPIAYALDGYPIYGVTEPDGAAPGRLDAFNGHAGRDGAYHYHSTKTYPYLNGGFHGEVTEIDGQVDPQPAARPVRPSGDPLRGATITEFQKLAANEFTLTYTIGGETRRIHYTIQANGSYVFDYIDGRGTTRTETYRRGRGRGGVAPGTPGGRP
jgi:hypothetical protein